MCKKKIIRLIEVGNAKLQYMRQIGNKCHFDDAELVMKKNSVIPILLDLDYHK